MRGVVLLPLLLLGGCRNEQQVEAPSAAEAAQLDNAEANLNALGNDEGSASRDADPSGNLD